jgi:hypothetical protein
MKCDRNKRSQPIPVDASAIEETLRNSETLWGALLPYYLKVANSIETEASSLKEAVSKVETSPANNTILLVGYEDGGVISVSGTTLPFQINAKPAQWWAAFAAQSAKLAWTI